MSQQLLMQIKDAGAASQTSNGQKVFSAVASTAALDRDKEVLIPQGVQISNFMKNPVMLFIHQQRQVPVGKVTDIRIDKGSVEFDFVFADTAVAKEVQGLYENGFMSAFSVGFYPKSYIWIEEETPKQMQLTLQSGVKYDLDLTAYKEQPRAVITDWELLEISPVPIPSNPEALLMREFEGAIQKTVAAHPASGDFARMKLSKGMDSVMSVVKSFLKEAEEFKLTGTVPSHSTAVDKDGSWDRLKAIASVAKKASSNGSGAKDTLDFAAYAQAFGWVNPEKTTELISYKHAHHSINAEGELVASLLAVRECMSKLLSDSHGGINVDTDLKEVYDHLAKHYADAGVVAPEFKLDYTPEQIERISKGQLPEEEAPTGEETEEKTDNTNDTAPKATSEELAEISKSIKVLAEAVAEVGESLSVRMGILLTTLEEVSDKVGSSAVSKTDEDVGAPVVEEGKTSEDDKGNAVEMLEEFAQAAEVLKSFSKAV